LKVACAEINEKADLRVRYSAKKTGKKYTHLHFNIFRKNGVPKLLPIEDAKSLGTSGKIMKRLMGKYKLSHWQVLKIIEKVSEEEINKELYELDIYTLNKKLDNPGGYVAKRFNQKYSLGLF